MRSTKAVSAIVVVAMTVGSATSAYADPHDHDHDHHGHGHDHDNVYVVEPRTVVVRPAPVVVERRTIIYREGPPPWAPAYGYRRPHETVYVAPYGIESGHCDRSQVGGLVGSVVGGVAGAAAGSRIGQGSGKVAAVAGGALLGVLLGGSIGRSLDRVDYACAGQVLEYAPQNRTVVWNNPQTGGSYQMTPSRAYEDNGRYCREYTSTISVGGQAQQAYGTACRQPDGSWQIVQ